LCNTIYILPGEEFPLSHVPISSLTWTRVSAVARPYFITYLDKSFRCHTSLFHHLPGQEFPLSHVPISSSSPSQTLPPLPGVGLVHSRVRVRSPLPQVVLHPPQFDQRLHPPFTDERQHTKLGRANLGTITCVLLCVCVRARVCVCVCASVCAYVCEIVFHDVCVPVKFIPGQDDPESQTSSSDDEPRQYRPVRNGVGSVHVRCLV
jgi:hypothetical protein